MKCPACGNNLQEINVSGVAVDVCQGGCGGIWFDNFELKKFDEPHESAGEELLDIERDEGIALDHTKTLKCPKCEDIIMTRHFFSVKKQVKVDECPGCGSFWLNAGELGRIRSLFNTEEEKNKAAEEYFSEVFGSQLVAIKDANEAKLKKAQKVSNIFRFICPSYYVPAKQDWGAY